MGGVDREDRKVHVAALSAALVGRGNDVEVFTRRDDATIPERVRSEDGYTTWCTCQPVPARRISKKSCLPHMQEFALGLSPIVSRRAHS
ncbi:hypothetical protein GS575_23205 [Rhodococcus hoagii]|nr:hypothetical protein [Prescottella equi]